MNSAVLLHRKMKEGQSKVEEKNWKGFVIPKKSKKPALETYLNNEKSQVSKSLFEGVKTILEGLEGAEDTTTTVTTTVTLPEEAMPSLVKVKELPESLEKMDIDQVTTISDTPSSGISGGSPVVRDKQGEEEEEILVVGGSVIGGDQEEEEITALGSSKSRSESPQIVSMTKDIPECEGVKVTFTKSNTSSCYNRKRKLTKIPKDSPGTIKAMEDIQSDDEFGSSQ